MAETMKRLRFPVAGLLMFSICACSAFEDNGGTYDTSVESALGAGISAWSGAVHLLREEPVVFFESENASLAAACQTTVGKAACQGASAKRVIQFSGCPLPVSAARGGGELSGSVSLQYPTSSCAYGIGSTVTRSYSVTRTLPDLTSSGSLGTFTSDSATARTDHRGVAFSGGTSINQDAGGTSRISIQGVRKLFKGADGKGMNDLEVLTRTTSSILVTNPLTPDSPMTAVGGALEFSSPNGKFVATVVPSAVTFTPASCCYPTGGTASVTVTGSVEETGTLSFSGACGSATYARANCNPAQRSDCTVSVVAMGCEG